MSTTDAEEPSGSGSTVVRPVNVPHLDLSFNLDSLIGRSLNEVREQVEAAGFSVRVLGPDPEPADLAYKANRIDLVQDRRGFVVDVFRG